MKSVIPTILVLGIVVLVGGFLASRLLISPPNTTPGGEPDVALKAVDTRLDRFVHDFNAAAGRIRLVFVVGPSCAVCLRGLDDMNRKIAEIGPDAKEVETFILYVPALGGQEHHARQAAKLVSSGTVHHYWDDDGASGRIFQRRLGINTYAWDVWMIFGRDARWQADNPPEPQYWAHQLQGLPPDNRLVPDRFARAVKDAVTGQDGTIPVGSGESG